MPKKILIVDDTKNIREIVAYLLRGRGYEVLESGDGEDARRQVESASPDLIVLDAMIPKKTGFELCAELKADGRWKGVPIIMLTAVTRESGKSDEYWLVKSRADELISKPFKAADLVERVERLLAGGVPPAGPP